MGKMVFFTSCGWVCGKLKLFFSFLFLFFVLLLPGCFLFFSFWQKAKLFLFVLHFFCRQKKKKARKGQHLWQCWWKGEIEKKADFLLEAFAQLSWLYENKIKKTIFFWFTSQKKKKGQKKKHCCFVPFFINYNGLDQCNLIFTDLNNLWFRFSGLFFLFKGAVQH